jgi:hypothetical protein
MPRRGESDPLTHDQAMRRIDAAIREGMSDYALYKLCRSLNKVWRYRNYVRARNATYAHCIERYEALVKRYSVVVLSAEKPNVVETAHRRVVIASTKLPPYYGAKGPNARNTPNAGKTSAQRKFEAAEKRYARYVAAQERHTRGVAREEEKRRNAALKQKHIDMKRKIDEAYALRRGKFYEGDGI